MIEDNSSDSQSGVDGMLVAYIIIGLVFGSTIVLFIFFMFKLKMKEGAAIDSNKVRNDQNASYNRFPDDQYPDIGMEK